LVQLIDAQLPKRDQGLSVGQYLVLAASHLRPTLQPSLLEPPGTGFRDRYPSRRATTLPAPGPAIGPELAHAGL
jgi:hypothetical protein